MYFIIRPDRTFLDWTASLWETRSIPGQTVDHFGIGPSPAAAALDAWDGFTQWRAWQARNEALDAAAGPRW